MPAGHVANVAFSASRLIVITAGTLVVQSATMTEDELHYQDYQGWQWQLKLVFQDVAQGSYQGDGYQVAY